MQVLLDQLYSQGEAATDAYWRVVQLELQLKLFASCSVAAMHRVCAKRTHSLGTPAIVAWPTWHKKVQAIIQPLIC
jgi:hypothetical protein